MTKHASLLIAVLCSVGLVHNASAHVTLIYPKGGESFAPGSLVKIEWRLQVPHDQQDWDLYFSSDGGATWEPLALNLSKSQQSYKWTVPDIETTKGEIRVVQDNAGFDYEARSDDFSIEAVATAVRGSNSLPASLGLVASYPNPFSTSMSLEFILPRPQYVALEVFDVRGVRVATIVSARLGAGRHKAVWQPRGLPSGAYLCRFEAGGFIQMHSVLLTE